MIKSLINFPFEDFWLHFQHVEFLSTSLDSKDADPTTRFCVVFHGYHFSIVGIWFGFRPLTFLEHTTPTFDMYASTESISR